MDDTVKFQVVEIPIPSGTTLTKFFFPEQPQLDNALIQEVEVYTIGFTTKTPQTFSTPTSIADMQNCFVTFQSGSDQVIQNRPILAYNKFIASTNPYTNNPNGLKNRVISWTKSFITFGAAPTGATAVAFGIHYIDGGKVKT